MAQAVMPGAGGAGGAGAVAAVVVVPGAGVVLNLGGHRGRLHHPHRQSADHCWTQTMRRWLF